MKIKNPSESDLLALKVFEGLKPFTITVNNGADAMYLSMALMNSMTGNQEVTNEAMKMMIRHARADGVQAAIDLYFNMADKAGMNFPEFIKPIMTLMVTHMFENKDKIKELIDKEEEDE